MEDATLVALMKLRRVVGMRAPWPHHIARQFILAVAGFLALSANAQQNTTFYKQIAPIVYQNCAPCHQAGGSAPFPLLTYADVKKHATQIAVVTKQRFMPPWLAEPGYGDFVEERRLTTAQIQLIQDWVKQGAHPGAATDAPAPPNFTSEWRLGTPDLVLNVPQPYQLAADGQEVFWNFVIPVPLTATRWVRAIELRPGNPRVIHHSSIILDRSRSSRARETTPGSGFAGMDLSVAETTFDPDGTFLAWKPGSVPMSEPDGMAWRADPGMDLVLNAHLRSTGKPETVSPSIGLYFTDKPQTKFPMLVELEHDGGIDIPAGDRDYLLKDDFRLPLDATILAVYPHAHYLGKLLEGYATLPGGTRKWLIRIPAWDLNWQGVYHFKKPVFLPRGTLISMRFHYDNSEENVRNPNHPPKRVRGGSQATDEMGNLWLQVLPAGDGDKRAVLEEALMRQRLVKYPDDFSSNFNLGDLMIGKGDAAAAISYFEKSVKAQPNNPVAVTEMGIALASASRTAEARRQFQRALELDPKFSDARFDLASMEAESGELEAAAADFKQVLAEKPDNVKAQQHLGEVLFMWGDQLASAGKFDQALLRFREALNYRANDAELHTALGMLLGRLGRLEEAKSEFEDALRIDPNIEAAKKAIAAIQSQLTHK